MIDDAEGEVRLWMTARSTKSAEVAVAANAEAKDAAFGEFEAVVVEGNR